MTEIQRACQAWDEAKLAEKAALEQRRQIEDWLKCQLKVPEILKERNQFLLVP